MKICLFDIDGTLLNTGGAGQMAMETALVEELNIDLQYGESLKIPMAGRTDCSIVSQLFEMFDVEHSDAIRERFQAAYLQRLSAGLTERDGLVLPGVTVLLDRLAEQDGVEIGLLTGNFEAGAWAKLKHYAIDHHFSLGGFGDHHLHRDDVAREVFTKVLERYGNGLSTENVWVIGDTPADVQCARAIDANVVAVMTGWHERAALEEAKPDYLFDDLSDANAFLRLLEK